MRHRSTHNTLIAMKQDIIERCLKKEMKWKVGASLLQMHPKALSRLKRRYLLAGKDALASKRPGPKPWTPPQNKTAEYIADLVVGFARAHPQLGPRPLAEGLEDIIGVHLDQTTIWRILTRRKERSTAHYRRWKEDPKLYCLDTVGEELQMDACYPYGRSRKVASFDAVDDCSRYVFDAVLNEKPSRMQLRSSTNSSIASRTQSYASVLIIAMVRV